MGKKAFNKNCHIHDESVQKSRSNLNNYWTNYQEGRKDDIFPLYHANLTLAYLHSLYSSVFQKLQMFSYKSDAMPVKGVESLSQSFECCFYHSVGNL